MKPKRSTLYLHARTRKVIGDTANVSGRINSIADRYNEMVQRSSVREAFTDPEWKAVTEVINDGEWEPAAVILASIPHVFQGACASQVLQRHGVDKPALLAKLSALSTTDKIAVVELAEFHGVTEGQENR